MKYVLQGRITGAVDEFLAQRIPIQLGGMNDSFSSWERERKKTLETLKILRDRQYPTLISTKSTILAEEPYLGVLASGNFLVRISCTAGSSITRSVLEKGVPSWECRLKAVEKLSANGVPVSIRFQPIIYGEEDTASNMIYSASWAGVRHISAEYLKIPVEHRSRQANYLARLLPHMNETYRALWARQVGRELVLPAAIKVPRLFRLKEQVTDAGMDFGFAENELLHPNSFQSCCNAADKFLKGASFFSSNILGILKGQLRNESVRFCLQENSWVPSHSIFSHLNSRSRGSLNSSSTLSPRERWVKLLEDKWNSKSERGGPTNFWGITETGEEDSNGNKVFCVSEPIVRHAAQSPNVA